MLYKFCQTEDVDVQLLVMLSQCVGLTGQMHHLLVRFIRPHSVQVVSISARTFRMLVPGRVRWRVIVPYR